MLHQIETLVPCESDLMKGFMYFITTPKDTVPKNRVQKVTHVLGANSHPCIKRESNGGKKKEKVKVLGKRGPSGPKENH